MNFPKSVNSLFPKSHESRNFQTYTTDSQVADSAASATAYLCGVKGNLGTIGVDVNVLKENCTHQQNKNFHVPSVAQWFQVGYRLYLIYCHTQQ